MYLVLNKEAMELTKPWLTQDAHFTTIYHFNLRFVATNLCFNKIKMKCYKLQKRTTSTTQIVIIWWWNLVAMGVGGNGDGNWTKKKNTIQSRKTYHSHWMVILHHQPAALRGFDRTLNHHKLVEDATLSRKFSIATTSFNLLFLAILLSLLISLYLSFLPFLLPWITQQSMINIANLYAFVEAKEEND